MCSDIRPVLLDSERDYVLRSAEQRGVRFVRLWLIDIAGLLKSFAIPVTELPAALEEGVGMDGSALQGRARTCELDVIAHPDPATFQILPWRPGALVARMFCDARTPAGEPFAGDSRQALRRLLDRAAQLGLTMQVGAEIEFFLFADQGNTADEPKPLDEGTYFDLTPLDDGSDFRRQTIEHLEQMGIPVKASHHEVAPSQHEIKLAHSDALSMADAISTFKLAVKEVAREQGVFASFMPKPLEHLPGSGMHLHISLFRGEQNAFHGGRQGAAPLSKCGAAFLAGLLAHAPELTAVSNQWVNSYKRLADGFEAPASIGWSRGGADALVRIPSDRPERAASARIELRSPDAACNPYLCLALVLAAGLRGIERDYELPAESSEAARAGRRLPVDLRDALEIFEGSELAREALGDQLCAWYIRDRRQEWDAYQRTVSEFERRRCLYAL